MNHIKTHIYFPPILHRDHVLQRGTVSYVANCFSRLYGWDDEGEYLVPQIGLSPSHGWIIVPPGPGDWCVD